MTVPHEDLKIPKAVILPTGDSLLNRFARESPPFWTGMDSAAVTLRNPCDFFGIPKTDVLPASALGKDGYADVQP